MENRPAGFTDDDLRAGLRRHHGIEASALRYRAVGFGDYHWEATGTDGRQWFVKVSDLADKPQCGDTPATALAGYRAALRTATELRDAGGLEFVVAPRPSLDGEPVADLDGRWALTVFDRIDAATFDFYTELPATDRDDVLTLLARLHEAPPPASTPSHSPEVGDRKEIEDALAELGTPWTAGRFSEPAREALTTYVAAVRARLAEADELIGRVHAAGRPRVVTHGEPHPGNLLRRDDGFALVDWDTVGLGVPERDLAVVGSDPDVVEGYAGLTGVVPDPAALRLYRLRWRLTDLGEFLLWFRGPHADDGDSVTAWDGLRQTLADLEDFPG
ncbi:aminoglycoside phosphotransferase family protein [Pseudonocardia nematodicida]|uniref:Aminoglycoside phosphotransferase family protein n=1 Tax=Pseudonocardia nematodicida TaxID=1206997 RepID=A0ABV1K8G8_9PSEU